MDTQILEEVKQYKNELEQVKSANDYLETIIKLRKLTSKEQFAPLQEIIESDICKLLIAIMDNSTSSEMILESLWIMTNVCSGSSSQTSYIIDIGGIASFLKYVQHQNEDVMAQALWGLGNIAGDSASNRDLILQQDAVTIVLKQLERKNIKLVNQRTIVWVISNFCRGKPMAKYEIVRPCIFYLGKAIENNKGDEEIISDSLWGINYLSENDIAIEDLINYGILQKICSMYIHSEMHNILTPAVRIIGNVATSNDSYVDFLLNQNVLTPLIQLFLHDKKGFRKESLWTVSNIMAGTNSQVLKVLQQPNFFQNLISNAESTLDVKKEMFFVISNSLRVPESCQFFLNNNILKYMFEELQSSTDTKIQAVIIEGLELLSKYIFSTKQQLKELVLFFKKFRKNYFQQLSNGVQNKFKSLFKFVIAKSIAINPGNSNNNSDPLTNGIEQLSLQEKINETPQKSDESYETVDDDEESYAIEDEEEEEEDEDVEIDEEEEEQELQQFGTSGFGQLLNDDNKTFLSVNNNNNINNSVGLSIFSQVPQDVTGGCGGGGANAQQIEVEQPYNFSNENNNNQITEEIEQNNLLGGAAAPPSIDYHSFYFSSPGGADAANSTAAPGP